MATTAYPLPIPDHLLRLADEKAREDRTDRSTALAQLLHAGAEDYVLELLAEAQISVSRAAELLDVSVYAILDLARDHGIETSATREDYERGAETARQVFG